MWDTESGAVLKTFSTGKVPYVVKFHPDEDKQNVILAGMADKKIVQWDTETGEITQVRARDSNLEVSSEIVRFEIVVECSTPILMGTADSPVLCSGTTRQITQIGPILKETLANIEVLPFTISVNLDQLMWTTGHRDMNCTSGTAWRRMEAR